MKSITIKTVIDLKAGQKTWEQLAKDESVYDIWEFRKILYDEDRFEPIFYVACAGDEPVGMLALQYNAEEKYLEFFGGGYSEDNEIFTKKGYEETAIDLLTQIDKSASLFLMRPKPLLKNQFNYVIDEYKYFQDISKCKTIEDFITISFQGKSKKNRVREMRQLTENNDVKIKPAAKDDIDTLVDFNIENLGEESDLHAPQARRLIHTLAAAPACHPITLAAHVNGKVEGATIAFFQNKTFTYFNAGVNKKAFPNLGKYLIFANIEMAIKLGAHTFDAGPEDLGWKELFNLQKKPLFRITVTK